MKSISRALAGLLFTFFLMVFLTSCGGGGGGSTGGNPSTGSDTWDVNTKGIPKFVTTDFIELSKIQNISRFRSAAGHDYSDDFEKCRSMKHYYRPFDTLSWADVKIYAPVSGTISKIDPGWAGTQIQIKSKDYPAFYFIIFHLNPVNPLNVGDTVTIGQLLGNHIGNQTTEDIAVGVNTLNGPEGWKLVSYFDVMTDNLFQSYQARGVASRDTMIITKEARDADPLTCNGETFTSLGSGALPDWVTLSGLAPGTVLDATFWPLLDGSQYNYDHGSTNTIFDQSTGFFIYELKNSNGEIVEKIWLKSDTEGLKDSKEVIYVDPQNYLNTGTASTPGYVEESHLWGTPFLLIPYGMAVGDSKTINAEEEISVPLGTDGVVANGCATQNWTDWKYVNQTFTETVGEETITVPAGTFQTLKIKMILQETNNPFNPCNGTSQNTQFFWLAKGVGVVQHQRFDGTIEKLVSFN